MLVMIFATPLPGVCVLPSHIGRAFVDYNIYAIVLNTTTVTLVNILEIITSTTVITVAACQLL
jgi:hypothetical protein